MKFIQLCLIPVFFFLLQNEINGQGHHIRIEAKNLPDTLYQFGHYKGDLRLVLKMVSSKEGFMEISDDRSMPIGEYFIGLGDKKIVDFLVEEQAFTLSFHSEHPYETMEVTGSLQNEGYSRLQYRMGLLQHEKLQLLEGLKNGRTNHAHISRLKEIDELMDAELASTKDRYPGTFLSKLVTVMEVITSGSNVKDEKAFLKAHFLDSLDMNDSRLLNTSIFHSRVMQYLTGVVGQGVIDQIKAVDEILIRSKANEETFKYWMQSLLAHYFQHPNPAYEQVYLHLIRNYYLKESGNWVPETALAILREDVTYMSRNQVGMQAADLFLLDRNLELNPVYDSNSKRNYVLFFYDPNCEHCRETAPELMKAYTEINEYAGLINICLLENDSSCKAFIEETGLKGSFWRIPGNEPTIYEDYDLRTTPKFYLISADRVIIAKNLIPSAISELLRNKNQHDHGTR